MENIAIAIITGLVSGGATWGALRVELRYLRRDIDNAHKRILELERGILSRLLDKLEVAQ